MAGHPDRISLFLHNTVFYPLIWLACLSIDVVPGFINNSLTATGLAHCVRVSRGQIVIYEPSLEAPLVEIAEELAKSTSAKEFVCLDDGVSNGSLEKFQPSSRLPNATFFGPADLAQQSTRPTDPKLRNKVSDRTAACLIFTSGTTGLPKAALCAHGRIGFAMAMWPRVNRFSSKDRIYTPMPLYHSSASFLCVGAGWHSGATVIIGRKFSATKYWDEVRKYDATVVQYIGEIARYLLAVPPHPDDKNHRVRLAYGNGMRPDVWEKFRERYNVPHIMEFYASSEGNGALINYNTGPFGAGAVGYTGWLGRKARPEYRLIQVDAITEDIYRGPDGLCVECKPNEAGEFVMLIDASKPAGQFLGYADNPEATNKKILRDVFNKGDMWFRSGDLMRLDENGHYWFGDRLGDTFRWRSENVSTAEVAAALGEVIEEANVYGVLVPNHDGRAGCAAIPSNNAQALDLAKLAQHARKVLPKYSVPLFLRIVPQMDQTGTVKQLKVALRNEGIDHAKCGSDPLYWLPPGASAYVPFEPKDLKAIEAGKVKL